MASSNAWDMQNWIQAALALDPDEPQTRKEAYRDKKRRVVLETGAQICWVPDGEGEDADAEIKLLITINVYLDMAVLYEPLPDIGKDLLGLILNALVPSAAPPKSRSESENRAAALRHFFACLRPAPYLPLAFHAGRLQPKEMVSRLLPFQARTVALLLRREGSPTIGNVKPSRTVDPTGFWDVRYLGEAFGRVAYRRVTGEMLHVGSSEEGRVDRKGKGRALDETERQMLDCPRDEERDLLPLLLDLSGVKGTMLCEEMG